MGNGEGGAIPPTGAIGTISQCVITSATSPVAAITDAGTIYCSGTIGSIFDNTISGGTGVADNDYAIITLNNVGGTVAGASITPGATFRNNLISSTITANTGNVYAVNCIGTSGSLFFFNNNVVNTIDATVINGAATDTVYLGGNTGMAGGNTTGITVTPVFPF